jgi:hypothetical protein
VWLGATLIAFACVRNGHVDAHRQWMIHAFSGLQASHEAARSAQCARWRFVAKRLLARLEYPHRLENAGLR